MKLAAILILALCPAVAQQAITVKVDADSGQTNAERELLVVVVFDEIEGQIDLAIADNRVDAN